MAGSPALAPCSAHLQGDEALATPGTAGEQRQAPGRQPASQHIIEPDDARRGFRQLASLALRCRRRGERSRP